MQDFLNSYFRNVYKPIPNVYNLVLAMMWRHPENVDLDKVKVVHYCAAVRSLSCNIDWFCSVFIFQPIASFWFWFGNNCTVNYCCKGSKPWRYTGEEENMQREDIKILVKKWWDIYEDESLDYKNCRAVDQHSNLEPLISSLPDGAVLEEGRPRAPSAAWSRIGPMPLSSVFSFFFKAKFRGKKF